MNEIGWYAIIDYRVIELAAKYKCRVSEVQALMMKLDDIELVEMVLNASNS